MHIKLFGRRCWLPRHRRRRHCWRRPPLCRRDTVARWTKGSTECAGMAIQRANETLKQDRKLHKFLGLAIFAC